MNRRSICCAALVGGALTGCASMLREPAVSAPVVRPFAVDARFSLTHLDTRWIGALVWDYSARLERLSLELAGQSFARIERLDNALTATLANGQVIEADSWRALTVRTLGVALPFEAAAHWVRGAPASGGAVQIAADNADGFTQFGWTVISLARDEKQRPSRLRWQNERTVLTLLIDVWRTD